MANRSDRGREQPAVTSRASKPAKQNGTSSAETIKASGSYRANRPDTRLHPTNAPNPHKSLATREPSTQDVLHGSARTTPRVRSELQGSQESTRLNRAALKQAHCNQGVRILIECHSPVQ